MAEIDHFGPHCERQNPLFYLDFRGLRVGSNPFCSTKSPLLNQRVFSTDRPSEAQTAPIRSTGKGSRD
jgi:hypothetical protein